MFIAIPNRMLWNLFIPPQYNALLLIFLVYQKANCTCFREQFFVLFSEILAFLALALTLTLLRERPNMEFFYYTVFGVLAAVVTALELSKTNKDRINTSSAFNSFKNNYLVVYSLMMGNFSISEVGSVLFSSFFLDRAHCVVLVRDWWLWIWTF